MGCGSSKSSAAATPRSAAPAETAKNKQNKNTSVVSVKGAVENNNNNVISVKGAVENNNNDVVNSNSKVVTSNNNEKNNEMSGSKRSVRSIRALKAEKAASTGSKDSGVDEMSTGSSAAYESEGSPKVSSAGPASLRARQKILRIEEPQRSSSVGSIHSIDQNAVSEITASMKKTSTKDVVDGKVDDGRISGDSALGEDDPAADTFITGIPDDTDDVNDDRTVTIMRPVTRCGQSAAFEIALPETNNQKKFQLAKLGKLEQMNKRNKKVKRKKKKNLDEMKAELREAEERRKENEQAKVKRAIETRIGTGFIPVLRDENADQAEGAQADETIDTGTDSKQGIYESHLMREHEEGSEPRATTVHSDGE